MTSHPEINALLEALKSSPENQQLRLLLIRKMKPYADFKEELENQVQVFLKRQPENGEVKQILAGIFFDKGNHSAGIIISEELYDKGQLNSEGKVQLAKAYLNENDKEKARQLYEEALIENSDLADETLDQHFRIRFKELEDEGLSDAGYLERPTLTFADVGGMDQIKKEIDLKIIKPMEHAELYASYGKKVGGGILLFGPPGCGKTYLAKATAGEIKANFLNVGLNDVLDMWLGNSEKNLHEIFEEARENTPCVMFFDEIDALGAKRNDLKTSAGKNVINQFLAELDGIESENEGVLIIGATNTPWHLDSAFRRPGRFDRIIFVPPPDVESKEKIFELKLRNKPIGKIDYRKLAKKTPDYSGADIDAVVDIAIEKKLVIAMETGIPEPIETNDLLEAIKLHKASTIDWFTTARNYAMFANQSGLYNDILAYLKK